MRRQGDQQAHVEEAGREKGVSSMTRTGIAPCSLTNPTWVTANLVKQTSTSGIVSTTSPRPPEPLLATANTVATEYNLDGEQQILHGSVQDIQYGYLSDLDPANRVFSVSINKQTLLARTVVLAIGCGRVSYPT